MDWRHTHIVPAFQFPSKFIYFTNKQINSKWFMGRQSHLVTPRSICLRINKGESEIFIVLGSQSQLHYPQLVNPWIPHFMSEECLCPCYLHSYLFTFWFISNLLLLIGSGHQHVDKKIVRVKRGHDRWSENGTWNRLTMGGDRSWFK